eukprot:10172680-Heterocapsa_arctica.AAC.1
MLPRRVSATRTGSGRMRPTYRPKAELRSMDILRVRRIQQYKVALAKNVQEHMLRNYIRYVQHTLVREDALKHNNIKGSPT